MQPPIRLLLAALLLGAVLALRAVPARAADTVVGTGTPASCTDPAFEAAFLAAQSAGGGTLSFNCGGSATIILSSPKDVLAGTAVTIDGGGQITLSGGGRSSVLGVSAGGTLTLLGLVIRDGFNDRDPDGNPLPGGGALTNNGTLVLRRTDVLDSSTQDSGGAIQSTGVLTVEDSLIRGNRAAQYGGGLNLSGQATLLRVQVVANSAGATAGLCAGGGIASAAVLTLNATSVLTNTAERGGGICSGGPLTLSGSALRGNHAGGAGGALFVYGGTQISDSSLVGNSAGSDGGALAASGTAAQLQVERSLISGNAAGDRGGGLFVTAGALRVERATLSANTAGYGGGLAVFDMPGTFATLTNVTLSGNSARFQGGGLITVRANAALNAVTFSGNRAPVGAALLSTNTPSLLRERAIELSDTLVAGDAGGQSCLFEVMSVQQRGVNLATDATCTGFAQIATAGLGPLRDNGDALPTHLPLAGSPAIDRSTCAGSPPPDQRGVARPQDGDGDGVARCDVGAVERRPGEGARTTYLPLVRR